MNHLITNACLLTLFGLEEARRGKYMDRVGLIREGAVLIGEGKILAVGQKDRVLQHPDSRKGSIIDVDGRVVMPGFVDSHTHPVFAEARLKDFELRVRGKSYQEIAKQGGGIVSSIIGVRGTTEKELFLRLLKRAQRFLECGTTTVETKTGYGLDKDSELKALRAIRRLAFESALEVIPTFLGAHAIPPEYRGRSHEYINMLCREVIPIVAKEGLARFVDAFCENGYFSPEESERFLRAGLDVGLSAKIHAEQLSHSGGGASRSWT